MESPIATYNLRMSVSTARNMLGNPEAFTGGVFATVNGVDSLYICTAEERKAELEERARDAQLLKEISSTIRGLNDVVEGRVLTPEQVRERLDADFPPREDFPFKVAPELVRAYHKNLDHFSNALQFGSCDDDMMLFKPFTTVPTEHQSFVYTIERTKEALQEQLCTPASNISLFKVSRTVDIWVVYDNQTAAPTNVLGFTNKNATPWPPIPSKGRVVKEGFSKPVGEEKKNSSSLEELVIQTLDKETKQCLILEALVLQAFLRASQTDKCDKDSMYFVSYKDAVEGNDKPIKVNTITRTKDAVAICLTPTLASASDIIVKPYKAGIFQVVLDNGFNCRCVGFTNKNLLDEK